MGLYRETKKVLGATRWPSRSSQKWLEVAGKWLKNRLKKLQNRKDVLIVMCVCSDYSLKW